MKLHGVSCFLLVVLISLTEGAPTPEADDADPSRLPRSSHPISYDITLSTDMDFVTTGERAFDGEVKIVIKIDENTNEIVLHNRNLRVEENDVTLMLGGNSVPTTISYGDYNFMKIHTEEELTKDSELTLEIKYTGELDREMAGFYRSSYRVEGGNQIKFLATTQFQATGARRAFPCYDEPEFKATFQLKIHHNKNYLAISNTFGGSEVDGGDSNGTTTTFAKTPIMSSYLLAFIVSEFDYVTNENDTPPPHIPQRVYAKPEFKAHLDYALEKSSELLNALEEYVGYDYEIGKMFSAAIPDFAAGAMENWGLITYKEQYLIVDIQSHHREKFDSMRVIAHELGHQFFGNLVTCKYWDETWLNEGFATVFEFLLVDRIDPQNRFSDFFNLLRLQSALAIDALDDTHPMTFDGSRNSRIIYDKAGSVIRMFQHVLTEEMFRKALKDYLTNNNHAPVTADHLYASFEKVISEQDGQYEGFPSFTDAYRSWVNTKGYPMITVTTNEQLRKFSIKQEKYYDATSKSRTDGDSTIWHIPLSFITANSEEELENDGKLFDEFMTEEEKLVDFPANFDSNSWHVWNKQQVGYYRVNYDMNNWNALISKLNSETFADIPVMNRAQLIDDSMTFASDGYLSLGSAMKLLRYLEKEVDYMPWRAALPHLDKLDLMLKGSNGTHNAYRKFVRKLLRRLSVEFSADKHPDHSELVRQYSTEFVLDTNCRYGEEECLRNTNALIEFEANGHHIEDKSLQIAVLCNGLRTEDKAEAFSKLYQRMQLSNDQSERLRIIDGLMCSPDKNLLLSLLETTLVDTEEISYKQHEIVRILGNIFVRSESGVEVLLTFFEQYYDDVLRVYSKGTLQSTLIAMSKRATKKSEQDSFEAFLTKMSGKIDANVVEQIRENIEINENWLNENLSEITMFLNEFLQPINEVEQVLRLPKTSAPLNYKLMLEVRNIQKGDPNFNGEVEIEVKLREMTNFIQMHSRGHIIDEYSVIEKSTGNNIQILELSLLPATDMLTIYFMEMLPQDTTIIVTLKYRGQLLTGASGFYLTSYINSNRETKYLATTQFEPTRARHAFPCYDEPEHKAVFELTIVHEKELKAIANTPGTPEESGDYHITTFEPTPLMSSYLNAFVISDLASVGISKPGETAHHIWVRPDSTGKVGFALNHSVESLKALEEYTGFPYQLTKVDSAGIPNKGGAMENWGMITYRENAMIYDEIKSSHRQKLSGADVIAHELSHQFFGDAVTCSYWDTIWLNEGFATLFEYHLMGMIHADWNVRHFFNIETLHDSFKYDSKLRRPMTKYEDSLEGISGLFDTIAYAKSGSVLRMFQNAVGEEIFRASLKLYLETNNHNLVTSQHLIEAFETVMANENFDLFSFGDVFRSWETQGGYPLMEVTFDSGKFTVTQHRFLTEEDTNEIKNSWFIPINFATKTDPEFEDTSITSIYPKDQDLFMINAPSEHRDNDWYIFNLQQLGYYRVNYDQKNWDALNNVLNSDDFDIIHILNRAQLIDDAMNLANENYVENELVIQLISYLHRETAYTPFAVADNMFSELLGVFGPFNEVINKFIRHLTEKLYETWNIPKGGFHPHDNVYDGYNLEISIKLACRAGNRDCLEDSAEMNKMWIEGSLNIPGGFENIITCNGMRGVDKREEFFKVWNMMQDSTESATRNMLINALSCSDDTVSIFDLLETTLGDGQNVNYSQNERRLVLNSVLMNSVAGFTSIIEFIEKYELDVIRRLGYGNLENLLSVIANEVKHASQRLIFDNYLDSLDHLDSDAKSKVIKVVEQNFEIQEQSKYTSMMNEIMRILEDRNVEPTDEPTQDTTTSSSSTSSSSTSTPSSSSSTTSSSTTSSSTTTLSTTETTSTAPTTPSTTTQGASNLKYSLPLAVLSLIAILCNNLK